MAETFETAGIYVGSDKVFSLHLLPPMMNDEICGSRRNSNEAHLFQGGPQLVQRCILCIRCDSWS